LLFSSISNRNSSPNRPAISLRPNAVNDKPDALLLDRPNRRSFTFGAGRHQCPGQALALSIAGATVRHILAMKPGLDRLTWDYRPSANGRTPLFRDWPVA